MAIEQSTLNGTTNLPENQDTIEVFNLVELNDELEAKGWIENRYSYKMRYTVHRQYSGFFTPMVFDVLFRVRYDQSYAQGVKISLDRIIEPFVEGALFVNHDSHTLVEFLKGQNFGFNRATLVKDIQKIVTTPLRGATGIEFAPVWYSDWETPPLTIQSQRVFVYDVDNPDHGSMLDPRNAVDFIARWFFAADLGVFKSNVKNVGTITAAWITAGYTDKVTVHPKN